MRFKAASGKQEMKFAHLTVIVALSAGTACTAERAISPGPVSAASVAASPAAPAMQVPLLYVVDGVRLQRDQVPVLSDDRIARVQVIKGHAALKRYGPDASYGVVLITTKAAVLPRS